MHNRLRMVAASFLVKDLGIDWRRGEALLRRAPDRLRAGVEQRRLAVGGVDRLRRAAVVPDLQPGDARAAGSTRRAASSAATCRSSPRLDDEQIHAPWELGPIELEAAGVALGRDYPRPIVDHAEARAKTLAALRASVRKAPAPERRRARSGLGLRPDDVAGDQRQQVLFRVGLAEVVVDAELGRVVAVLLRRCAR